MGREYKIKFKVKSRAQIENFLQRISKQFSGEATIDLEENGFYFCDNYCNSPEIASHIFRPLVDEALSQSEEVIICEL